MTINDKNIIVFMDSIGRTIFAEKDTDKTTEDVLCVYNPVVVHTQPNPQNGQMALQLFPVFFREFLADKSQKIAWKYNRKSVVETDGEVVFDFRLKSQYANIISNEAPQGQPQSAPIEQKDNVIKLFDDDSK